MSTPRPNHVRALVVVAGTLLLAGGLAACGSDEGGVSTATTAAAAGFDKDAYCAAAKHIDVLDDALDAAESPAEVEAAYKTTFDAFKAAGALAPADLKDEYAQVADASDDLQAIFEEHKWAVAEATSDEDFVKLAGDESTGAASDTINSYDETTCGITSQ